MKALTVFLFVIIFNLCACWQTLRIMWNPSDNADNEGLTHYTVYKWQGDSLAWQNWQESDMDSIGIVPHILNYGGAYEFTTYFAEDMIICGGLKVQDSLGRVSEMGLTKFYFFPTGLTEMWIEK